MALFRFSEGQLKESIPRLFHSTQTAPRFPISRLGINGPFPIFRGPAERVYPQTLSLHPDCASLFCFKARDKTVPRTVLFIQVPDVFIILFDGAVR